MRVKLESLIKPKCQIYPYGTEVKGWTGEEPFDSSRIKIVPREVKLALYRAKAAQSIEAPTSPGLVRKPSSRLPDPGAPKVTTRSAKAGGASGARPPSSDGADGRTPSGRRPWTEEDDERLFQLRRELPGRALAEVGARMQRTASSVHARWAKHQKEGTLPDDLVSPLPGCVPPHPAAPSFLTPPTILVPLPPINHPRPNPAPLPSLPSSSGSPGYGWSAAETDLLIALCNHVPPPSWEQIAARLPGRTADACARRHRRISNKEIMPASTSLSAGLVPAVTPQAPVFMSPPMSSPTATRAPLGPARPSVGSARAGTGLSGASAERDRKRKRSGSTPGGVVAKSEWSKEENELLLSMVECDEPKSWAEVKDALPGRSEGACRGRYGRILKEREADANSKVGIVEVAPASTPPVAKPSSSSEAARSSSVAPVNDSFFRAVTSELSAMSSAPSGAGYLSSMVRLPALPPVTGLGIVPGPVAHPAASPGYHAAFLALPGNRRMWSGDGSGVGEDKENEGRGAGGAKRVKAGGEGGCGGRKEGEEGAASALMRMNGW